MLILSGKRVFILAVLMSMIVPAFAEEAPVYEADSYPPSFDGQTDGGTEPAVSPPPQQAAAVATPAGAAPSAFVDQSVAAQPPLPTSLTMNERVSRVEQQVVNLQHSDMPTKLN